MGTTRGLERIIFFTDAVVAIAITLLVLPLVEIVPAVAGQHEPSIPTLLADHVGQIGAFVLSFAVIARLWVAHHSLFEHVNGYHAPLLTLNLLWAFTIVLLPLPTAITAVYPPSTLTVALYIGLMSVNSIVLTIITLMVRNNPHLELPERPIGNRQVAGSVVTTVAFLLALAIGILVPGVNYWGLLLLAATGPIDRLAARWLNRHDRGRHDDTGHETVTARS
jgi:uncharacterized membrane protein